MDNQHRKLAEVATMGRAINWMAYIWLITSETGEELFYRYIGDHFRRLSLGAERREQAPKVDPMILRSPGTAAEAADMN
jgi:hypothetical protein